MQIKSIIPLALALAFTAIIACNEAPKKKHVQDALQLNSKSKTSRRIFSKITQGQPSFEEKNKSLSEFLPRVQKQKFTISTNEITTIKGAKGTVLEFPENAFKHKNGSPIDGPVEIELIECYDLMSCFKHGLTTTHFNRAIETNGMCKISAFAEGKPVEFDKQKNYFISFPAPIENANQFQLFYGNQEVSGIMNWLVYPIQQSQTNADVPIDLATMEFNGYNYEKTKRNFVDHIAMVPTLSVNSERTKKGTTIWLPEHESFYSELYQVESQFQKIVNPSPVMISDFCGPKKTCKIQGRISTTGKIIQAKVVISAGDFWDKKILQFIDQMVPFDMSILMPNYDYNHTFTLEVFSTKRIEVQSFNKKSESQKGITNQNNQTLRFNSNRLGWINCDRFLNYDNKKEVLCSSGKYGLINVYALFKNEKSLLAAQVTSSSSARIKEVPAHIEFCIMAFSVVNNVIYYSITEHEPNSENVILKEFKAFNAETFQKDIDDYITTDFIQPTVAL